MATRKPKATSDHFIKALNPRDADTKYMGDEPYFPIQPEGGSRTVALTYGFTWYNRFYGKKDAKELMAQYLDHNNRESDAKIIRKVDEKEFLMTLSWLARMTLRGLELTEHEELTLQNEISRLVKVVNKPEMIVKEKEPTNRPNIQELMREKARDAAGELEGLFDEFYTTGKASTKIVDVVAKFNVMQNPHDSKSLHVLGRVYFAMKDMDSALVSCKMSVIADRNSPLPWVTIAKIEMTSGRLNEAKFAAQKAIDLGNTMGYEQLAHILILEAGENAPMSILKDFSSRLDLVKREDRCAYIGVSMDATSMFSDVKNGQLEKVNTLVEKVFS